MERQIIDALKQCLCDNNVTCHYAQTKSEAVACLLGLLNPQEHIHTGGSATLAECGILDTLEEHGFLLHRHTHDTCFVQNTPTDVTVCDMYLSGVNAITEAGELYFVDGGGNRVAAVAYGARRVILVAGINKIVPDLDAAIRRVKTVAAPRNAALKKRSTPCAQRGKCMKPDTYASSMTAGCDSPERICNSFYVMARQPVRFANRVQVVLVGEDLGF